MDTVKSSVDVEADAFEEILEGDLTDLNEKATDVLNFYKQIKDDQSKVKVQIETLKELKNKNNNLKVKKEKLLSVKKAQEEMIGKVNTYKEELKSILNQLKMSKINVSHFKKFINYEVTLENVNENLRSIILKCLSDKEQFVKITMDVNSDNIIEADLDNLKDANIKKELLNHLETNKNCKVFFAKINECIR